MFDRNNFQLSEKTISLIESENNYQRNNFQKNEKENIKNVFLKNYKQIKSDTWPDIENYEDFDKLSDSIKSECINQYNFSKDIYLKNLHNDARKVFDHREFPFVKKNLESFLLKHSYIIKNKKILDFACNYGYISLFCFLQNCLDVIGVDIRQSCVKIANSIRDDIGEKNFNSINFYVSDIHNYKKNFEFSKDRDTVLLLGIMYHVHDHFEIINSILQSNPQYLVIESTISLSATPCIEWEEELTNTNLNGWYNNQQSILIGVPSVSWFDMVIRKFGYKKIDQLDYMFNKSYSQLSEFDLPRSILLYSK